MLNDILYIVCVVFDILELNGLLLMVIVCVGILVLMDVGVKIKVLVFGIVMGLVIDDKGCYVIFLDILGDEDYLGDMDFKVCGIEKGIIVC